MMEPWSGHGFPVYAESIRRIECRLREFVRSLSEQHRLTNGHEPLSKPLISCPNPAVFHITDPDGCLLAELILTSQKKDEVYADLKTDSKLDHKTYLQLIACIDPKQWYGPALLSLREGEYLSVETVLDNIASTLSYFIPWLARRSPSMLGGIPGYNTNIEITHLQGYETGITNPINVYQELILRTKQQDLPEWRGTAIHYTLEEIAPGRIRLEAFHEEIPILATQFKLIIERILDTWPEARHRTTLKKQENTSEITTTTILFIASDPSDLSRLRLGEEVREIGEKLQLAKNRDKFKLEQHHATRVADLTQALLDVKPNIVHFSGHGTSNGRLCLEDNSGVAHVVSSHALGALFEQFASDITCVVLNACHSELQAKSIAKHVAYVIGMSESIPDRAAVAFSVGFYQALGAGRSIEDAYQLGCVQIALQGIPEHLTPILLTAASLGPLSG